MNYGYDATEIEQSKTKRIRHTDTTEVWYIFRDQSIRVVQNVTCKRICVICCTKRRLIRWGYTFNNFNSQAIANQF